MFKRKAGGSKYGAKKTVIDDIKFDSIVESKYYLHLKELVAQGKITKLELQPSYIIMSGFKHNGVKIRDIVYRADFKYFDVEQSRFIVADVKGMTTADYKIKAKMFLKLINEGIVNSNTLFHEVYYKAKKWEVIVK